MKAHELVTKAEEIMFLDNYKTLGSSSAPWRKASNLAICSKNSFSCSFQSSVPALAGLGEQDGDKRRPGERSRALSKGARIRGTRKFPPKALCLQRILKRDWVNLFLRMFEVTEENKNTKTKLLGFDGGAGCS